MSIYHIDYRPKKIDELDIPSVREILQKVLDTNSPPRAFLFCGPKGSGKTSAARVVARVINKLEDGDTKNHIDIMELDGASNRGIDDVRSLREKAFLLPAELPKKVFIIDEVHMLTKEAFNALLKTLEEPPEHTVFILCTTDPQDIPDTVLSRLFRVDFRKASKEEIVSSLEKIVKGEKLKVEKLVLETIFEKSEGSFRNAAKILNEYVVSGKDSSSFFAEKWGDYYMEDFEKDLLAGETKLILTKLEKMAQGGVDIAGFTISLLEYFQKQIFRGSGLKERLTAWLGLLLFACKQAKDCPIGQLPLQLAVVEFLKDVPMPVEEKMQVKSVGAAVAPDVVVENEESGVLVSMASESLPCSLEEINNNWLRLLTEVGVHNRSVAAFLKASKPISVERGELTLEVFYDFHKQQLEDSKNRQLLERCVELVCGKKISLVFTRGIATAKIIEKIPVNTILAATVLPVAESIDPLYDVAKEIFG